MDDPIERCAVIVSVVLLTACGVDSDPAYVVFETMPEQHDASAMEDTPAPPASRGEVVGLLDAAVDQDDADVVELAQDEDADVELEPTPEPKPDAAEPAPMLASSCERCAPGDCAEDHLCLFWATDPAEGARCMPISEFHDCYSLEMASVGDPGMVGYCRPLRSGGCDRWLLEHPQEMMR